MLDSKSPSDWPATGAGVTAAEVIGAGVTWAVVGSCVVGEGVTDAEVGGHLD
jgi:hypothetical protein